jgi:hypothetical protein
MAVLDAVKEFVLPDDHKIPPQAKERLKRGREEMLRDANKRRLCMRYERGETYWYISKRNTLVQQALAFDAKEHPYRIRNSDPNIRPIVEGKVSSATQRVPGFEVLPTSTDPERVAAARLGDEVAQYGYDKWRIKSKAIDTVKLAISGGGEGFAMPYFDPDVGPYHQVTDPQTGEERWVGEGEVKIKVFNANEVYWEPEVEFAESRWWATEQAVPLDVIKGYENFMGGRLTADASGSDIPSDKRSTSNLAMVVDYYERPCPEYPNGQKLRVANGRLICPPEDYPVTNREGKVLDEPVLHRLHYTHDADGKRDLGLVWQDCMNKLLEWKNRCLNPQMSAPVNSLLGPLTDEPGKVNWYRPQGGQKPEWEKPPAIPRELFDILERVKADMRDAAADEQITAAPDVAAQTIQTVLETARLRWGSFLGDVADWYSSVMRHCLLLVSRHYTEKRVLQIRGSYSPYPIEGFLGASLMDEQDVRVDPESIRIRSRKELNDQIMQFAQLGWIKPEAAMAAMNDRVGAEKTDEFERTPPEGQTVAYQILQGVQDLETQQAMRAAQAQAQQAEALGMNNAASPQAKPLPSLPATGADNGSPSPAQ